MLNGLDLFSGIGGIALALSPWVRPIAYCENDRYAQSVLLQRMQSGEIGTAPIWDDITTFLPSMLPRHGVDIVYGGFPCQDISVAGNGKGLAGERSGLVFEIFRLVKEIKPPFIFLENVPAIRTRGGERVGKELAALGYDCRWDNLSAFDVGAPHKRERWFMLANSRRGRCDRADDGQVEFQGRAETIGASENVANHQSKRRVEGLEIMQQTWQPLPAECDWWSIEPNLGRVVDGLPNRVDRIKGLGNAVVPAQANEAFRRLIGTQLGIGEWTR